MREDERYEIVFNKEEGGTGYEHSVSLINLGIWDGWECR